jgi:hexosaminidase
MKDPLGEGIMELPDPSHPGEWSDQYADRLERAEEMLKIHETVSARIDSMQSLANRNLYRLEVYERVDQLAWFTPACLMALKAWDTADDQESKMRAQAQFMELLDTFSTLRDHLEQVYGKTRILEKPADYILDQDHHQHLANQTRSFDWLFTSELFFIEKARQEYP